MNVFYTRINIVYICRRSSMSETNYREIRIYNYGGDELRLAWCEGEDVADGKSGYRREE